MVKKIFLGFIVCLLLLQFVIAIPTEIKIKTIPYSEVLVKIVYGGQVIQSFNGTANYFGDISFQYSSSQRTFDMYVQVRNLKETLYFESYPETKAGDIFLVELYPSNFEFPESLPEKNSVNMSAIANVSSNASLEQNVSSGEETAEKTDNSSKTSLLTNFAILDENGEIKISIKTVYYIIGIIILAVVIFFIAKKLLKRKRESGYYGSYGEDKVRIRKLSDIISGSESSDQSAEFVNAEKKLKEAETELNRLKNKDKIDAIQKKIEEQQRELRKLQSGR